jgi:gas vesicle protein
MKKQILVIGTTILTVLLCVGGIVAQDAKTTKMDMTEMHKSPHHLVMMAYQQNVLSFARVLRDMTKDGKLEDVELARNAFAEIKHSMEKMDGIHQAHMSKMSAEMSEKMKPMMEKMQADKTAVKEHILALEKALQADAPDALEVQKHAAALVLQLEKMDKPDMKMKM